MERRCTFRLGIFQNCEPAEVRRNCSGNQLEAGDVTQEADAGGRNQCLPPEAGAVLGRIESPEIHVHPKPQNVSLFREKVFADVLS